MKNTSIDFGSYYTSIGQETLVRTIARATDSNGENPVIIYCIVQKGGFASEAMYMSEVDFIKNYIL